MRFLACMHQSLQRALDFWGCYSKNENWLSPVPAADGGEDFGQFQADATPQVPTPDRTILEQTDLSGCISWSQDGKEAADLSSVFADVFSRHDLGLEETSVVEHEIKLELNSLPFCERYCPIPQSMYEEVQKHLQEMLEVGAIRPLSSPWASAVVLV